MSLREIPEDRGSDLSTGGSVTVPELRQNVTDRIDSLAKELKGLVATATNEMAQTIGVPLSEFESAGNAERTLENSRRMYPPVSETESEKRIAIDNHLDQKSDEIVQKALECLVFDGKTKSIDALAYAATSFGKILGSAGGRLVIEVLVNYASEKLILDVLSDIGPENFMDRFLEGWHFAANGKKLELILGLVKEARAKVNPGKTPKNCDLTHAFVRLQGAFGAEKESHIVMRLECYDLKSLEALEKTLEGMKRLGEIATMENPQLTESESRTLAPILDRMGYLHKEPFAEFVNSMCANPDREQRLALAYKLGRWTTLTVLPPSE